MRKLLSLSSLLLMLSCPSLAKTVEVTIADTPKEKYNVTNFTMPECDIHHILEQPNNLVKIMSEELRPYGGCKVYLIHEGPSISGDIIYFDGSSIDTITIPSSE